MNTEKMSETTQTKKNQLIFLLIKILSFLAILYYILFVIDINFVTVYNIFSSTSFIYFFLLLFLFLVVEFIQAPIVTLLMRPYQVYIPPIQVYQINLMSSLYSILPFGTIGGGIVRWYRLSKENKKRSEVFTVIILQRILSIIGLLFLGGIILIFENPFGSDSEHYFFLYIMATVIFSVLIVSMAVLTSTFIMDFVDVKIVRPLLSKIPNSLSDKLNKLWIAVLGYKGNYKTLFISLLISIVYKIGVFFLYYFIIRLIGIEIAFLEIYGLYIAVSFVIEFVPIFGGIGFNQAMFTGIYSLYDVPAEQAFTHSLVIQIFIIFIGGILEFYHQFIRKKRKPC